MKKYMIIFCCFLPVYLIAQIRISSDRLETSFPLVDAKKATPVYIDKQDYEVVATVAGLFKDDVQSVTGKKPTVITSGDKKQPYMVIIGTIGSNKWIDQLEKNGKLQTDAIKGDWERFLIRTIDNPFPEAEKALVIAGSDRRGTAYGVFTLSEAIGVSPWAWWADVPVNRTPQLYIPATDYVSAVPSVKYRGIFINDEGWGITPWAAKTYDTQLGDIGPKTYTKVFELILRLKGNMLAPAMHPSSGAFNKYPENKKVADQYGILMSSSHCEPLLFNNVTEWDEKTMGEWNYLTNREGILKVLEQRVKENSPYENIYTIAMRGIHDAGIVGVPKEKQVELLETVIRDQRALLDKYIDKPIEEIPQIFVPYKEVLDIYEEGLNLPDDITIVWPDDNFGYFKKLTNEEERKRPGGSGIYYHISYLGEPHDYLWLNTTPPALMFEELRKAYDSGADRYWLLNVGDIKPGELGMQLFLDMAWDINQFSYSNINDYQVRFLSSVFGEKYHSTFSDILSSYYQLAFQRKPEAMGWGWEWNNGVFGTLIVDTDFSFVNYNEAERRLVEYARIASLAEKILNELPAGKVPSFYQLLYYPVKGASLMNHKMLTAQKNRWYANQGRAATNTLAEQTRIYHDSIQVITDGYNRLLNGKWNHMMGLAPGWNARYQDMPPVETIQVPAKADMKLFVSAQGPDRNYTNTYTLPCFNPFIRETHFVEIYNKGRESFAWEAVTSDPWIKLSSTGGIITEQERVYVSVDYANLPKGESITGTIRISGTGREEIVHVPVFNPEDVDRSDLKGMYMENNGYISIDVAGYHRKTENKGVEIQLIEGLGYENKSIQLGNGMVPNTASRYRLQTSCVEYDFYTFNAGTAVIHTYALPLFAIDTNAGTHYGVMVDNGMVRWPITASPEYSEAWKENVIRNSSIYTTTIQIDKPGKYTLKIFTGDSGMIIQKVVIDMGGLKRTYLGPPLTRVE
ncbi:MAG: glycosyl hydrolase 115 family protein [Tannerellaceae bacterium]|nr:glycosyl hydrolase 115 family protein [Tannerellaceae bacterium]